MKFCFIFLFLVIFQTSLSEEHQHQHQHQHQHHHQNEKKLTLTLNKGKKWKTDKALRRNMTEIHDQIKENLIKINKDSYSAQEYKKLSQSIKRNIDNIFANCKLIPEADAQLHIILSDMLSANSKLDSKENSKVKKKAVLDIINSYKAYILHFNHNEESKSK